MLALIGAAGVLIASAIGFSATTTVDSPPSALARSVGVCERLPARALVRERSVAVVFSEVSYAIDQSGDRPRIDLAGRYLGDIDEGRRLVLITQADPGSHDSTPDQRPGDGHYFYQRELQVDEETRCWSTLSLTPGYPGSRGLVWHVYFAMVPVDFHVTSLAARDQVADGVFRDMEVLAAFTVAT